MKALQVGLSKLRKQTKVMYFSYDKNKVYDKINAIHKLGGSYTYFNYFFSDTLESFQNENRLKPPINLSFHLIRQNVNAPQQ